MSVRDGPEGLLTREVREGPAPAVAEVSETARASSGIGTADNAAGRTSGTLLADESIAVVAAVAIPDPVVAINEPVPAVAPAPPPPMPALTPVAPALPPASPEIEVLFAEFVDSYEHGRLDAFAALFDDDADTNLRHGRAAIRNEYDELFRLSSWRRMQLTRINWRRAGDTAYAKGENWCGSVARRTRGRAAH
jgi:hypothetical protein